MRAELIIARDGKAVGVIKGAKAWIESRAVAYRLAGFDIVISIIEKL